MKKMFKISLFLFIFLFLKYDLVYAYKSYKYGDKVSIYGYDYYVLEDSGENQDYIYIIREKYLSNNELYKYGKDENGELFVNKNIGLDDKYRIKDGEISFYTSDTCYVKCDEVINNDCNVYSYVSDNCNNDYDTSDVKKILENWKKDNFEDYELNVVNGYDVKLLDYEDLVNKLKYEYVTITSDSGNYSEYYSTNNTLKIDDKNEGNYYSWTMFKADDKNYVYAFNNGKISDYKVYNSHRVRPTLYLKKCTLDGTCKNYGNYQKYKNGQTIKFRGDDYYVLEDSDSNQDYIKLLKTKALTVNDIQKYGLQDSSFSDTVSYYNSLKCNSTNDSECKTDYKDSDVKILVDNWANDIFYDGELKEIEGYKARLINEFDLVNNLHYEASGDNTYHTTSNTIKPINAVYWTMISLADNKVFLISNNYTSANVYELKQINPVVNLNKCALNGTCKLNKSNGYKAGDEVIYNGQKYHVLKTSDDYSTYVTLLKDEPLTEKEIKKYYDGNVSLGDNIAVVPFTNVNNNAYNKSFIKNIINKWAKDEFKSDLMTDEKNKMAVKLLSTEDLVQYLGFEWGATGADATSFAYLPTENTPEWFKNIQYNFWLMTPYEDSTSDSWVVLHGDITDYKSSLNDEFALRPVVNVDKCAINPNSSYCKKCNYSQTNVKIKNYKEYSIGEVVSYKGENYHVVQNSNKYKSYVTLLKKDPLTYEQVNNFGKNSNNESIINNFIYYNQDDLNSNEKTNTFNYYYSASSDNHKTTKDCLYVNPMYFCDSERVPTDHNVFTYTYDVVAPGKAFEYEYGYGGMAYYTDNVCSTFIGTDVVEVDKDICSKYKNYNLSNIKVVVDNWQKNVLGDNNLIEIDGYKVRLLKFSEYHDLIYNLKTKDQRNELKYITDPFTYSYWLMDSYSSISKLKNYDGIYNVSVNKYAITYPAVRPVINVDKCALEDGCFTETFNLTLCKNDDIEPNDPSNPENPENPSNPENPEDPKNPDKPNIVDVENTASFISKISIIISIILIISGVLYLSYNLYKNKKSR